MTSIQSLAVFLYACAAVFALAGPAIGAIRVAGKYRASKDERVGTWDDPALDASAVRATALRDATWGIVEFGFVALGVVLASAASIMLVVPAA